MAVVNEAVVGERVQISSRSSFEVFGYIPKGGMGGIQQYFSTACEGLVLLLLAEGTGPVVRTFSEESLSGPEALLSRGSPTCTSVCMW